MSNSPYPSSEKGAEEENISFDKIVASIPSPLLVLSPDYKVKAATDTYLQNTLKNRDEILGRHLHEIFPENPQLPEAGSWSKVKASLDLATRTRKPHSMEIVRYDIPDPEQPGQFLERFWQNSNTPVFHEQGHLLYIIHEAKNVTQSERNRQRLEESQQREKAAQAHADQQRVRLERLFEQAPAGLAILEGPDFVYRVINKSYQQLFPGRKMMGVPLFEALPELKGQPIHDIIQNVYDTGETFEGKEVLVPVARYEGQPPEDIYWNFIYQALFDAQGQVNGILIFALDVTPFVEARLQVENSAQALQTLNYDLERRVERRTQEAQLAKAEAEWQQQRLHNLFMDAPAAICILNGPELVYELVNPEYEKLFPGRQLLGKPILEGLPEIKDNEVYKTFQQVYDTGHTHQEPELLIPFINPVTGALENRYFRYIQQARYNEESQVDGIVVFALEVTEQVEAREAIEASARQLRLVTDALPVLIGYLDKEEKYRFTNKAYEQWFPIKAQDLLGRNVRDVVGEKAYAATKDYMQEALAGKMVEFEATMPYREGFTKHIKTSYVPDEQDGEIKGFYTLVTDVTEQVEARKRIEKSAQETQAMAQELAAANEELRLTNLHLGKTNQQLTHINVDLDNFIYTASHDLRGPISNIEMLLRELLYVLPPETLQTGDASYILTLMKGSIERFIKTINNLTEITKLQKDNNLEASLLQIDQVVEEVKLDLEPLVKEASGQIQTHRVGTHKISYTEKNLRSIIYNLLSNAIKYRHPERQPVVQVSCEEQDGYLVLSVQDNGLGLSVAQKEQLYIMFRRFHDHVDGSGVGLYMVKRIVDNAGGKIEVESQLDEGTTFKVYFLK